MAIYANKNISVFIFAMKKKYIISIYPGFCIRRIKGLKAQIVGDFSLFFRFHPRICRYTYVHTYTKQSLQILLVMFMVFIITKQTTNHKKVINNMQYQLI